MKTRICDSAILVALLTFTSSALAHHPMDGKTPSTFSEGLLSGFGHPVIGIDHLAFIIAIGLISAFARLRTPFVPIALVSATVVGATSTWQGASLPYVEVVVAASVVLAGIIVFRRPNNLKVAGLAASVAAVFHGLAYGEAIIGAETGPLGAYLLGFSVIQMVIAGAAFGAGKWALSRDSSALRVTRNVGASVITGVGLTALFTSIVA